MMKLKKKIPPLTKVITVILLCSQTVGAFDVSLDVISHLGNRNTLACGENVTFLCSSKPATDSMDWFIDNTIVATCKFGFCAPQSTKPLNAVFEYSTSEGIYNLTFAPILESDGAREYKCMFGSDIVTVSPKVSVFPDIFFSGITNSTSSNDINITVSTCVPSSDLVSFEWYIYKTGETRKPFGTLPKNRMNESRCQSTSNCNGEMSTSTVTIKNLGEENGEYYYFQVEIIYDAKPLHKETINSPTQYKISETSLVTDDNGCEIDIKEIIFIVLMSVARIYAIQIVLSYTIYESVMEYIGTGQGCIVWMVALSSSLPILGFIPLLITILYVFFKKDTIEWSVITMIIVGVILDLLFGPIVIYNIIGFTVLVVKEDTQKSSLVKCLCCSLCLGIMTFAFELFIFIHICQDCYGYLILAPIILDGLLLLLLVSACIFFLTVCLCHNSNKYCCHEKNQVTDCSKHNQDAKGSRAQEIEDETYQKQIYSIPGWRRFEATIMSHHSAKIQNEEFVLRQQQNAGKGKIKCGMCKGKETSTAPCAYCFTHGYICTNCLNKCCINCVLLWNTHNKENLFNCSLCSDMFPVVCYDVVSRVFKCVNCSQLSTHTPGKEHKLPGEVSNKISEITHDADEFQRHKEVSHDGESSCSRDIYCLVCKLIMCKRCFRKHTHDKPKELYRYHDRN